MKKLIAILILTIAGLATAADAPKIAGKWDFVIETPHGTRSGVLSVQQDGAKVSGTCELEGHDAATVSGSIEGPKVSMKLKLHGNSVTLIGTVEGNKMSGNTEPLSATWKAARK